MGLISGDYKVYQHTLYRATYGPTAAGWRLTCQAATETQLLNVVRGYSLEDFYKLKDGGLTTDESIIGEIVQKTLSRVSKISPSWGVTITGFKISHFEAPEEMTDKLLELWAARYAQQRIRIEAEAEKAATILRGEGEAGAITVRELARAEAQTRMVLAIRQGLARMDPGQREALLRLRFYEAIEKIAGDPATKILLPNFRSNDFDTSSLLQDSASGGSVTDAQVEKFE